MAFQSSAIPPSSEPDRAGLGVKGNIFAIKRYAIHDGPGIRVTVFFKGCPLRCIWCHNPEGQEPGLECNRNGGATQVRGMRNVVREISAAQAVEEIEKDVLFFDESGGGATFSGGEPLMQPGFLRALLLACKAREIHTVLDTCGYAPAEVFESIVGLVDLFLYDLKLIDDATHREYTGASNQPILRNLKTLAERRKKVVIRFPLIPEITDTEKNVRETIEFVSTLNGITDLALLPYHRTAEGKYERLKLGNRMEGVEPPSAEKIESIKSQFESHDFHVTVGG